MNNKGADQTALMRCSQTPKTGFLASRPICYIAPWWSTLCYEVRSDYHLNVALMHPTKFQCNQAKTKKYILYSQAPSHCPQNPRITDFFKPKKEKIGIKKWLFLVSIQISSRAVVHLSWNIVGEYNSSCKYMPSLFF